MPNFAESVLSVRPVGCDQQLRFWLCSPSELNAMEWPIACELPECYEPDKLIAWRLQLTGASGKISTFSSSLSSVKGLIRPTGCSLWPEFPKGLACKP